MLSKWLTEGWRFGHVDLYSSGGGFSNFFAMPSYQAEAVINFLTNHTPPYTAAQYNNSGKARGFPDLSANGFVDSHTTTFQYWHRTQCKLRHCVITFGQILNVKISDMTYQTRWGIRPYVRHFMLVTRHRVVHNTGEWRAHSKRKESGRWVSFHHSFNTKNWFFFLGNRRENKKAKKLI